MHYYNNYAFTETRTEEKRSRWAAQGVHFRMAEAEIQGGGWAQNLEGTIKIFS